MNVLNYNVTPHYPAYPARRKTIVNAINPNSYYVAKKDVLFRDALQSANFLLPDDIWIVRAAKWLNQFKIEKITKYDVFIYLMKNMNVDGGTCFFLGVAPATLVLIKQRALQDFPNVKVHGYGPSNNPVYSAEETKQMIAAVNEINPDVLFMGMTTPNQEKWVQINKESVNSNIICSIGSVFDFYAGTVQHTAKSRSFISFKWLPRFIKNPRLFLRDLICTLVIFLDICKVAIKA